MNIKDVINPPKQYRPIPFWSWNDRLRIDETVNQIEMMNIAGLGGYIMHARGGLITKYMGEEWFENISAGVSAGERLGMHAWAYDENGWPSGFADSRVNAMGEKYCQKYLRIEKGEGHTEHTIINIDGYHIYYDINPFYVDNLDEEVVKEFIKQAYDPYYERFADRLEGLFTDEPQLSRNGIPWSMVLPEKYKEQYGEELEPKLIHLFKAKDGYKDTRKKFWRLITKVFSESYTKQIFDWCQKRNLKLTGHMVLEETLESQLTTNGAVMPHYEYFHIPGIDWLGRDIGDSVASLQVASAAAQTGKKQILSESFALCGHNVSFSELRRIYEWQMVHGINLLCPHLQGYSMRGIRKRDYPPAMFYQQPWWKDYRKFTDSMSRIGMLISEGKTACKTLLIHPQTSAWICYDADKNEGLRELNDSLVNTVELLESKHVQFHFGDEILIERYGKAKNGRLIIDKMSYDTIILPKHIDFFDNTKNLLDKFVRQGGRITTAEEIEANPVTDNKKITYLKRVFDDFDMHYFVNSTTEFQNADINVTGKKLDIMTGKLTSFESNYIFSPMDSLVIISNANDKKPKHSVENLYCLSLDGKWEITECSENSITLDYCDLYIDGKIAGRNIPVTSVQNIACSKKRALDLKCVFNIEIKDVPKKLELACEAFEKFKFFVNSREISFKDTGFFIDRTFRKTDIAPYIGIGKNTIELSCIFEQSEQVYQNIEKAWKFETERNKLTYDMEIEPIYLVGDFSVATPGSFEILEKDAVRYNGSFELVKPVSTIELSDIQMQGFPFFAGYMKIQKTIFTEKTDMCLRFDMHGINSVDIMINKMHVDTIIWNNTDLDISSYIREGENVIELTITNNLRNLMGPHHLEEGESYMAAPSSFFKNVSIWSWQGEETLWNDGYCFVRTALK